MNLYLLQVLLLDSDSSLEAAAFGHFHVHGTDVILAFFLTFPSQSSKPTEGQASRLRQKKEKERITELPELSAELLHVAHLDFGGGSEDGVVGVLQTLLLQTLRLGANEQMEVRGQVASQQRFAGRNIEQQSQSFNVEAWLQHLRGQRWEKKKELCDFYTHVFCESSLILFC